jgi:hypothetical protein
VAAYDVSIKSAGKAGLLVKEDEKERFDKAKQRKLIRKRSGTQAKRVHAASAGANFPLSVVNSSIHPDTGEPVTLPFRMSAFVPTNLVICAGMLMPNPSTKSIVLWQFLNQTLNVSLRRRWG